ncbi:unnamed protein product [Fusarium graminearum]|nr:unnamed protein product [Fusarium graminearum]
MTLVRSQAIASTLSGGCHQRPELFTDDRLAEQLWRHATGAFMCPLHWCLSRRRVTPADAGRSLEGQY